MRRMRGVVVGAVLMAPLWSNEVGAVAQGAGQNCTGSGGTQVCQPKQPEPVDLPPVPVSPEDGPWRINRYDLEMFFRGNTGTLLEDNLPGTQMPSDPVSSSTKTPASPCELAAKGGITLAGDPVDYSNGNLLDFAYDFSSNGEMPLYLQRGYSSVGGSGIFGRNWTSNFDLSLVKAWDDGMVTLIRSDRSHIRFTQGNQPGPGWYAGASNARVLSDGAGGYVYYAADNSVETYNAAGQVTSQKNSRGIGLSFVYASGKLVRVMHSSGRTVELTWTGELLTSVRDPAGNVYQYGYTDFGPFGPRLSSAVLPGATPTTVGYTYTSNGALMLARSVNGVQVASFAYDATQHAVGTELAGGLDKYSFAYTFGRNGSLSSTVTNPLGKQTTYTFLNGKLQSVTGLPSAHCPGSDVSKITYDTHGNRDRVTDFAGGVTDYDYDEAGRLVRMVEAAGTELARETVYSYDSNNRNIRTVVTGVSQTDTVFRADGLVSSVSVKNLSSYGVAGQLRITSYGYSFHANGMLQVVVEDGPLAGNGDAITRTFDAVGNLLSEANALGHTRSYSSYNGLGLVGRITGVNGDVTDYTYDARGRLTSTTTYINGTAATTTRSYDGRGRLVQVTEPDGIATFYQYDDADRLMRSARSNPHSRFAHLGLYPSDFVAYTRDAMGNITRTDIGAQYIAHGQSSITEVITQSSYTDYDELGRVRASRGNNGQHIRYTYDANGNVQTTTDSLGKVTSFGYDALGRLAHTILPDNGGTTWNFYNTADQPIIQVDARGNATSYGYDGFGQLWAQVSPDTGTTTYQYDSGGQLTRLQRHDGSTVDYAYDGYGRLVRSGTDIEARHYSYDSCQHGASRLCSIATTFFDAVQTSSIYGYSREGQLTVRRDITSPDGQELWTAYSFDTQGHLAGISYPTGVTAGYGYNGGALTVMQTSINGSTQTVAANLTYQPGGALSQLSLGNAGIRERHYDTDGRLLHQHDHSQLGHTYSYDANNRITAIDNWARPEHNESFGYDAQSRLTTIGSPAGDQSLAYDANGNRTAHQWWAPGWGPINTPYVTEAGNNRLTSEQLTYSHDARGNRSSQRLADGTTTSFTYDAFNRLREVNASHATNYLSPGTRSDHPRPAGKTEYTVNARDQRVRKVGPLGHNQFVYDGQNQLLADQTNGSWTSYLWLGGEAIAVVRNSQLYFLHNDHLGRPEVVSNSANQPVWSAANYAFDRKVLLTTSFGELNLGFPGQYFDTETGFWYNGYRDYDSRNGRYLQSDPIGLAGGWNTYGYVGGNPVILVDPLGLESPGSFNNGGTKLTWERGAGRAPDFIQVSVTTVGFSVSRTLTRSGKTYFAGGIGTREVQRPYGISASISAGWLNCPNPSKDKVDEYVGGFGQAFAGGYQGLGGSLSTSPGNGSATLVGLGMGYQIGAGEVAKQDGQWGDGW